MIVNLAWKEHFKMNNYKVIYQINDVIKSRRLRIARFCFQHEEEVTLLFWQLNKLGKERESYNYIIHIDHVMIHSHILTISPYCLLIIVT